MANTDLSSNASTVNLSNEDVVYCTERIPRTSELFRQITTEGCLFLGILVLFSTLTVAIYVEEIHYIRKHFRHGTRTMWVLAIFPVFSCTALLAVFIPRSGVIIDMIANAFFVTCLYNFGRQLVRYMGGTGRLWKVFNDGRIVAFNTFPVCCCCFCLPRPPFQMSIYNLMRSMLMQVVIIRPILTFIAVVIWTDGTFQPGSISARNPYTYIGILNALSTMTAVYGLMLLRNAFRPELEKQYRITGKVMAVQLALICTILPNMIISILVATNTIHCSAMFPSKARGEAVYHCTLVLLMLPLSMLGQTFFRRASDNESYFDRQMVPLNDAEGNGDGFGNAIVLTIDGKVNWDNAPETKI